MDGVGGAGLAQLLAQVGLAQQARDAGQRAQVLDAGAPSARTGRRSGRPAGRRPRRTPPAAPGARRRRACASGPRAARAGAATPWPTPVEPACSRSISASSTSPASRPKLRAAISAITASAWRLLAALTRRAIALRSSRSPIFMLSRYARTEPVRRPGRVTGGTAVADGRPANASQAASVPSAPAPFALVALGVDPADVAVGPAIYHGQSAVRGVSEHDCLRFGQVELHAPPWKRSSCRSASRSRRSPSARGSRPRPSSASSSSSSLGRRARCST